ncbi:MAG: adenosine kinase [Alphaproteobacteria bacterium]|nr:adenosine kinase [Alphaproteobacteria bacterium]
MKAYTYGIVAIGNALVDVIAHMDDSFIEANKSKGMVKGGMTLVDEPRANELYGQLGPATEMSGGSAANTVACYASLGGRAAYIGKVADDQLGQVFTHDMRAQGVHFNSAPLLLGPSTARCMILVTPDAQRTMNTYLGACCELTPADIDEELIAQSAITYLEGYFFSQPSALDAFYYAAELAHAAGNKIALTLSDTFCVNNHRQQFLDFIIGHVDILFANEAEALALCGTDKLEDVIPFMREHTEIAAITRSAEGSIIITKDDWISVPAVAPEKLVDTTGAGDSYAAGFLYGLTTGKDLATSGRYGSIAAAHIIAHLGARALKPLSELID